jgi:hypothetical protein
MIKISESDKFQVKVRHKHARKCKKAPGECKECQDNIKWFAELPLQTLSQLLQD